MQITKHLQNLSSSISNGVNALASHAKNGCTWSVKVLQTGWTNYISPAMDHFAQLSLKGFSASKSLVKANPMAAGLVGVTAISCLALGYLFGSKKSSAPNSG
jgi:hypothetical protein